MDRSGVGRNNNAILTVVSTAVFPSMEPKARGSKTLLPSTVICYAGTATRQDRALFVAMVTLTTLLTAMVAATI